MSTRTRSDAQYCTGVPGVEQCPGSELQDCTGIQSVEQRPGIELQDLQ